ncbi:hypothetical protein G6F22_016503 [Rhizopus arrhizus]|nr:hypothetical protein G6F22_016503 [Rhizopus arrhizus]
MNGTPTPSSSTTCLRPVTLSSSVMLPPSITMLFREKRGRPSSGLGGSSGLAADISATRCCMLAQRQTIDNRREPEQGAPGGAGIQFGQRQQWRLRAGLGYRQVAGADGQGERIEGDLADGNLAADHLGHIPGQDVLQHFGDLPCGNAAKNQRDRNDAQKNLAGAPGKPKLWAPQGHRESPDTS